LRRRPAARRTGTGGVAFDDPQGRFEELVADNYAALLGYARRRGNQPADAADVVCDVFLVAWRRIDDVPPGREGRLWLYGVARRTLANHRRVGERREALDEKLRLEAEVRRVESPDPFFAEPVNRALGLLSDDDREVLTLTAWEGLSPAEIATLTGVPSGTVRVRLHRARRRLEEILDAEDSVDGRNVLKHVEGLRTTARRGSGGSP
jgi:RNA polymerase sigma-70 factor (ECF subfamily)